MDKDNREGGVKCGIWGMGRAGKVMGGMRTTVIEQ